METQRNRNTIGETGVGVAINIRRLRLARGISTRRLAEMLKDAGRPIPATSITKIEKHSRTVDVDDLVALGRVLGVAPEVLLTATACSTCKGEPPTGFICRVCGAEG